MKAVYFILFSFFLLIFLFGCTQIPVCGNGVCESNETDVSCSLDCPYNNECTDSDNGTNYFEKGTTKGYDVYHELITVTDYCGATNSGYPDDTRYVHEYGCNKDASLFDEDFLCEFGCMNGACASELEAPLICETDYFTPVVSDINCVVYYKDLISSCTIQASTGYGHTCTPMPLIKLNIPLNNEGFSPVKGIEGEYFGVNCNSTESVYNSTQFSFNCNNKD